MLLGHFRQLPSASSIRTGSLVAQTTSCVYTALLCTDTSTTLETSQRLPLVDIAKHRKLQASKPEAKNEPYREKSSPVTSPPPSHNLHVLPVQVREREGKRKGSQGDERAVQLFTSLGELTPTAYFLAEGKSVQK